MLRIILVVLLTTLMTAPGLAGDTTPPTVVSTQPANGAKNVDPAKTTISATFSEPMKDGNWSWAYTKASEFPEVAGKPRFENGDTKNILPVKLEPGRTYVIWLNSKSQKNFKDRAGNPSVPFKWTFSTRAR